MNISNLPNSFLKRLYVGANQDPARDWITALIFSAIVLVGIIVWNAWAFDIIARGGVIGSTTGSSPTVLNSPSLDGIHAIFIKRAAEEAQYKAGTYIYVDPSQ